MPQFGPDPIPLAAIRERVVKVIDAVITEADLPPRVHLELSERLTALASDLIAEEFLRMLGITLAAMPPSERKSRMFDMLREMGGLNALLEVERRRTARPTRSAGA